MTVTLFFGRSLALGRVWTYDLQVCECSDRPSGLAYSSISTQAVISLADPQRCEGVLVACSARKLFLAEHYACLCKHCCCSDTCVCLAGGRLLLEPLDCLGQQAQRQPVGPDISALNKTLQKQWDYAANLHLGNAVIAKFSSKVVWWKCTECPDGHLHQWQTRVRNRSNGTGCPQCSGRKLCKHNCLSTIAPGVAAYWDTAKNGCNAAEVVAQSNQPVHWRCTNLQTCMDCVSKQQSSLPFWVSKVQPSILAWQTESKASNLC